MSKEEMRASVEDNFFQLVSSRKDQGRRDGDSLAPDLLTNTMGVILTDEKVCKM